MRKRLVLSAIGIISLFAIACTTSEDPTSTPTPTQSPSPTPMASPTESASETIVDVAVADGRFTTLVAALEAADLVDTLSGEGPFTVFAPTDDAFDALPEGTVDSLLNDIPTLTEILTYHVVSGEVDSETVAGLNSATTLQGEDVEISVMDGAVMINDAEVIIADIKTSNGIIHVIDSVLMPPAEPEPTVMPSPSATTLQGSDVTVTVEDGEVFINDAQVIITDIVGTNGVIHVIDAVLMPPSS